MLHPDKWKHDNEDWKILINRLYNTTSLSGNDLEFLIHTIIEKKPKSTFKQKPDVIVRFDCLNQKSIKSEQSDCTLLLLENFQNRSSIYRLKQILNSPKLWPSLKKIDFVYYIDPIITIVVDLYSVNLYYAILPYMQSFTPLAGSPNPPLFLIPDTDAGKEITQQMLKFPYFNKRGSFLHYPWLGRLNGGPRLIVHKWNDEWFGKKVKKVVLVVSTKAIDNDLISQFERIGPVEVLLIPNSYKYQRRNTFQIKSGRWIDDINLIHVENFQLVFREGRNFIQASNSLVGDISSSNIGSRLPIQMRWTGERKEQNEKLITTDLCRVDSF